MKTELQDPLLPAHDLLLNVILDALENDDKEAA